MADERIGKLDTMMSDADLKAHIDANGALPLYEGLGEVFRGDGFDEADLMRRIEVNVVKAQRADPNHAIDIAEEGILLKIAAYRVISSKAAMDDPDREALYALKQANEYMILAMHVDADYRLYAQREAENAYRVQATSARQEGDVTGFKSEFAGRLADQLKAGDVTQAMSDQLELQIEAIQGALAIEPEMPSVVDVAPQSDISKGQARDISAAKEHGQTALYAAFNEASQGLTGGQLAAQQHQYLRNMYELTKNNLANFTSVEHRDGKWQPSGVQEYMEVYLAYVENLYTMEKDDNRPELRAHRIAALDNLKMFAKYAAERLPGVGSQDPALSGRHLANQILDIPRRGKLNAIRGILGKEGYEPAPLSRWAKAWQGIKSFFGAKPASSTYEELSEKMPAQESPAKDESVVHFAENDKPMPTGFEESAAHESKEEPEHDADEPEPGKGISPGASNT